MDNEQEQTGPFAYGPGPQPQAGQGNPFQMPPPEFAQQVPPHWAGYYHHPHMAHPPHWGHPPPPPYWHGMMAAYAQQAQQMPPQPPPQGGPRQDAVKSMLKDLGESAGLGNLVELLSLDDKEFWKGALVGAAITLLASNENVRASLMGTLQSMMAAVNNVGKETPKNEPETQHDEGEQA